MFGCFFAKDCNKVFLYRIIILPLSLIRKESMISAPKSIGGINDFKIMVDQLGYAFVLRHLAINRTTLTRWLSGSSTVPRAAVLALYWECHWGRQLVDSDHLFEVQLLHQKIGLLMRENSRLVNALSSMEKAGNFTSANTPVYRF